MLTTRHCQRVGIERILRWTRPLGVLQVQVQPQRSKSRFVRPDGVKSYEDDYLPEAIYPPIDPVWNKRSVANQERHQKYLDWQKTIRNASTVEEKIMELNRPHIYGFYTFMLSEDIIQYDSLPFHEFITRTHLMPESEFPSPYSSPELTEKVRYFSEKVKGPLTDVLKFEFDGIERRKIEDQPAAEKVRNDATSVANQVSRLLLQILSNEDPYYRDRIQVDWESKTEAFWMVGGFARSKLRKKQLKNRNEIIKYREQLVKETDPVELNFQYMGKPIVQIRSEFPLGTLVDEEGLATAALESPPLNRFDYSPQDYYAYKMLRTATNIAGHWSGDPAKCNLLSIHSSHHLHRFDYLAKNPAFQARTQTLLHSQGVLVSFTKMLAAAFALGFDQFVELAEPLTSQTILTNGRDWSFYGYQLNTLKLDRFSIENNKKQNICWGSRSMSILDSETGNLNPSVLEMLLKFYLLPTLAEQKKPAMPYVKSSLDEIENDHDRHLIHHNFITLVCLKMLTQRPFPETFLWEKIFKIDHNTRPLDARRKHYELPDEDPYNKPWRYQDPARSDGKMLRKLKAEVAARKEAEKLAAVKASQKARFHRTDEEEEEEYK